MLENLFLLLLALVILLFISLLWLRQGLFHSFREVLQHEALLKKDFEKRRDTIPYLLESARVSEPPSDTWLKLAHDRAWFHHSWSMEKENEFEETLKRYLQGSSLHSVNFLDAKKDISDLTTLIEKEKLALAEATDDFNRMRKQFPYSLAARLFGFSEKR